MKTLKVMSALLPLLLAACSHGGESAAVNQYVEQVHEAVAKNFTDPGRYVGKRCDVTAQRRGDGGYNVMRTEGDEALCLRAWQSVSSARNLPLPPKDAPVQMQFEFAPTN